MGASAETVAFIAAGGTALGAVAGSTVGGITDFVLERRTLEAAGVRQVRFHDLRHTFGTRMAAAGVPMRTLQEWLGHRDFKTTLIYADHAPGAHEVDLVNGRLRRP